MLEEKTVTNGLLVKKKFIYKDEPIKNRKAKRRQKIRNLTSDGKQFNLLTSVVLQLCKSLDLVTNESKELKEIQEMIKKITK